LLDRQAFLQLDNKIYQACYIVFSTLTVVKLVSNRKVVLLVLWRFTESWFSALTFDQIYDSPKIRLVQWLFKLKILFVAWFFNEITNCWMAFLSSGKQFDLTHLWCWWHTVCHFLLQTWIYLQNLPYWIVNLVKNVTWRIINLENLAFDESYFW